MISMFTHVQHKICSSCRQNLPATAFYPKQLKYRVGLSSRCRSCITILADKSRRKNIQKARQTRLKTNYKFRYGITIEEKEQMIKDRESTCDICKKYLETFSQAHVDHCHKSNRVRGILCENCNRGIGLFKDNIDLLEKAIYYLQKTK